MAQCIHLILRRHLVDVKPRRSAEPSAHKRLPRCVRDIAEIVRDIKTAPSCAAMKAVIKAVMRRHYAGTFMRAMSLTSKS